jgi:hypothetical protein
MKESKHITKARQKLFVKELTENICRDVMQLIDAGDVPENWDGHELRCWLADRFEGAAAMSLIRRESHRARAKSFKNHCIVHNL